MGFVKLFAGVALIVGSVFIPGLSVAAASLLASAGAGMVLSGLGTLLSGKPVNGYATTVRDSKPPWQYVYGYTRVGGTMAYVNFYGDNNNTVDLIIVLADHPCQIDQDHQPVLLFDGKRVQIDTSQGPPTSWGSGNHWGGRSFSPAQQTIKLNQSGPVQGSIVRSNGVVTVTCPANIPYLIAGEDILISNLPTSGTGWTQATANAVATLGGKHQVEQIIQQVTGDPGYIIFTYLSGGEDVTLNQAGWVETDWSDYGNYAYVEWVDGTQQLSAMQANQQPLFWALTADTVGVLNPPGGIVQDIAGAINDSNFGPSCALMNKTAALIRLTYNQGKFPGGIPQISFLLYGKNNIYDPRKGNPGASGTTGYTDNAALCIADFLADTYLGFSCVYGSDIPLAPLITAANQCDQSVALAAGGSEPMYTCDGKFESTTRAGEVLRNMLTSCAGRITTYGGQFILWPGVWNGASPAAVDLKAIAAGPVKWKPISSITERYNACKGTYVSSGNKWQSTDFPYYAQDAMHGYDGPSQYGGDINLASDNGMRRFYEIQLPFTTSASMAQRIAKIYLLRSRQSGTGTFALNMAGYSIVPMDILSATHSILGWSGKILEVEQARLKLEKEFSGRDEVYKLGVDIDVQETDSDIYAWSTEEELTAQGYTQVVPPTGQAP
ncbi:MAG TPA: phage tail protein, partial [Bryobacteraceae bacterium]|nr:phage tail protein [Bryobacteraceae bacterium]